MLLALRGPASRFPKARLAGLYQVDLTYISNWNIYDILKQLVLSLVNLLLNK